MNISLQPEIKNHKIPTVWNLTKTKRAQMLYKLTAATNKFSQKQTRLVTIYFFLTVLSYGFIKDHTLILPFLSISLASYFTVKGIIVKHKITTLVKIKAMWYPKVTPIITKIGPPI